MQSQEVLAKIKPQKKYRFKILMSKHHFTVEGKALTVEQSQHLVCVTIKVTYYNNPYYPNYNNTIIGCNMELWSNKIIEMDEIES